MEMTDQARQALVLAAGTAHGLGEQPVDSYHLLIGLAEAEGGARHALDLDPARLRAVDRPAGLATAKTVVDRARAAVGDRTTTSELLLAVLDVDAAAVAVLRDAGVDPEALRAAAAGHDTCCGERGDGDVRAAVAEVIADVRALPGRGPAVVRTIGGLAPYLLLYVVVLAVTWKTSGPELILVVAAAAILLRLATAGLVARGRLGREVAGLPAVQFPAGELRPLLDRLDLRELTILLHPSLTVDRCYRWGRRGWVILSAPVAAHPDVLRFVLWHEMAHLARRDGPIRGMRATLVIALGTASVLSFDVRAILVAVVGGLLVTSAGSWWQEISCDRLAVARTGPGAIQEWVDVFQPSSVRGLLTHPPAAWRTRITRTAPAAPGSTA
ncbi:Clp protease N-terminal domain-containing protein [Actinoplanes philippinensis]|uniref:Clp protease N-terminal domain-containing protein n=1 Tax=Actinoplanes philippinensis TaxID=35752 RepID=UPI0033EC753B